MKFNSFTPLPDEEELHLPELVQYAALGETDEVKRLLDNDVDVNTADHEGYSALHAAAENGYLAIVELLVKYGADTKLKGEYTALELAEMAKQEDIVNYLKSLSS